MKLHQGGDCDKTFDCVWNGKLHSAEKKNLPRFSTQIERKQNRTKKNDASVAFIDFITR